MMKIITNQWRPTAVSIPIIPIPMALAHLWLWLRFEFGSALALDQLWLWISFGFGSYRKNIIYLNHQQKKLNTFCFLTFSVAQSHNPRALGMPCPGTLASILICQAHFVVYMLKR